MIDVRRSFLKIFDGGLRHTDPVAEADPNDPDTGVYKVLVRDVDSGGVWGKETLASPEMRLKSHGSGFLRDDAFDEVAERIDDVEAHRGEHVATVVIDVDEWDYGIRMEV